MKIDITTFERAIAKEYLDRYEEEMKQGDYELAKSVMNIAASASAIAIKQYIEANGQGGASNAGE